MHLKTRRSSGVDHQTDQMRPLFRKKTGPVAIGTGLVALDIVVTDRNGIAPRCWAGGTCFNVLAILAYLGWRVYPVATLGQDAAAQRIFEDLKRFGIRTRFLGRSPTRHTPVVVEKDSEWKSKRWVVKGSDIGSETEREIARAGKKWAPIQSKICVIPREQAIGALPEYCTHWERRVQGDCEKPLESKSKTHLDLDRR